MKEITSRPIGDPPWILVGVFTASLALYLASPVITSGDSAWTTPTALSLIHERNPDLNEYPEVIARHNPKAIEWIDGRAYSIFPIAISLTAVPFVWTAERVLPKLWASFPALETLIREKAHGLFKLPDGPLGVLDVYPAVELVAASTYTALAVTVFFIIARRRLSLLRALTLTVLFGFGSSLWSTASRALWSHGPAILLLLLALLTLTHPTRKRAGIAGLFMAMAFLIRPTFALPAVAFGLFLLINNRRSFLHYSLTAAGPVALFLIWNIRLYGQPLQTYFSPTRILVLDHVVMALTGHLISPARGLLVYSPFLILTARPLYTAWRSFDLRKLDFFMACVVPLHLLVVSTFWHWWGGYSIGPRLMTDILPILFWFLIPVFARIEVPTTARQTISTTCIVGLCVWSPWIHGHAAASYAVYFWNDRPVSVDQAPERLWDWRDPPFLRFQIPPSGSLL